MQANYPDIKTAVSAILSTPSSRQEFQAGGTSISVIRRGRKPLRIVAFSAGFGGATLDVETGEIDGAVLAVRELKEATA